MSTLPSSADVVVIGGGIIGCSVAYHLAHLGKSVVLLERKQLTCGTTWHSAGHVGYLRPSLALSRLAKYSGELYRRLEAETGQPVGYLTTGGLNVASTPERLEALRRAAGMGRSFGIESHEITPAEVSGYWPLLRTDDLVGALFIPGDARCNPVDITTALSKGARAKGAKILQGVKATGLKRTGRRIVSVQTDAGEIEADAVVDCGGIWGRDVAAMAGQAVSLLAAEHYYLITEPIEGLGAGLPVLRDQDSRLYGRDDTGKLLLGTFEAEAKAWGASGIPEEFSFEGIPEDWEHCQPLFDAAMHRLPIMNSTGIRLLFCGPESFSSDNSFHLGPMPGVDNFYAACGFNSLGVQSAGGAGQILAQWIADGVPPVDVAEFDVRRIHPFEAGTRFLEARVTEVLGKIFSMPWPQRQFQSARGVRRSPLHPFHVRSNAVFGQERGGEIPHFHALAGETPEYEYSWDGGNWLAPMAREMDIAKTAVGLVDLSHSTKICVSGDDALRLVDQLTCSAMPQRDGQWGPALMLTESGGIDLELGVQRNAADKLLLLAGANSQVRLLARLEQHAAQHRACALDQTSASACFVLVGPQARDLLTSADVALPAPGSLTESFLGYAPVRLWATRVGETEAFHCLVPTEFAAGAVEFLEAKGVAPIGLLAWSALQFEAGVPAHGRDYGNTMRPLEVGLGHLVDQTKSGDWTGKASLGRAMDRPPSTFVAFISLDEADVHAYGTEPVLLDGKVVSYLSAARYIPSLGRSVGFAHLPAACSAHTSVVVEVGDRRVPATLRPAQAR